MENKPEVTVEKQGSVSFKERLKVFKVTVVLPILQFLYQFYVANGSLDGLNWEPIIVTAVISLLGMSGIQLAEPTKVVIEKPKENTEAIVKNVIR